jgi:hypothetical protein
MPREHLLNADFDLSLRPTWRRPEGNTARNRITDLQWHAFFLGQRGDSVIVPERVPDDFVDSLVRVGIEPPVVSVDPAHRADCEFSPAGWNTDAIRRNLRYRAPADHPPPEVVARVNGRRYSAKLERELFDDRHVVGVFEREPELYRCLSTMAADPCGWVVKAEHGNAGLANRRLRCRQPDDADRQVLSRLFADNEAVVLERWRRRTRDLCATFELDHGGRVNGFDVHEAVTTADGALIGGLFDSDPRPLDRWRAPMAEAARLVGERLASEGYFGPVCLDAMVWRDGDRESLRPLVDLNARREVSAGASALWRRLGGRGAAYWRFFTRRKLDLPEGYRELERALGDDTYDPASGTGVVATAPLWLGCDRRRPTKAAFLMLGNHRDHVLQIDHRMRRRFER